MKRFNENAELQVIYVPKPGMTTGVGVATGTGTTYSCAKTVADAAVVTVVNPSVRATVQTLVQPKTNEGEFRGSLRAYFAVEKQKPDGTWVGAWTATSPASGFVMDGMEESLNTAALVENGVYRLKTLTQSYWTTGGVTSRLSGAFSAPCHFRIDTTVPVPPKITSGLPYSDCTDCEATGGPGIPGDFTFAPGDAAADIKSYRWRLEPTPQSGGKVVAGSTVTVNDVTPLHAGTQTLVVEASDLDGQGRARWGGEARFVFQVATAQGPMGRWRFAADGTTSGSTVPSTADSTTEGVKHDITVHAPVAQSATWSAMSRRGEGDYSLQLNDTIADPAQRTGHASTSAPVVDTKNSFTVSAWAYLTDASQARTVLSAPGSNGTAFALSYSASAKWWEFSRTDHDRAGASVTVRSAAVAESPPLRVWTHLTGVFNTQGDADRTNDTIQLFINGSPQGAPVKLAAVAFAYEAWTASGPVEFGRTKVAGVYGQYFMGRIDEVAIWKRAMSEEEIRLEGALTEAGVRATELVRRWEAESATADATELADASRYQAAGMKLFSAAVVNEPNDEVVLNGSSSYMSSSGPAIDETGSFTVTARVRLDSLQLAGKPVGYRAQIFGQAAPGAGESSWALWAEKVSTAKYVWRFGRTATDTVGNMVETASVTSMAAAVLDEHVQVTGVFDAAAKSTDDGFGKTYLYLGAAEQTAEEKASFTTPMQGSGSLAAGQGSAGGITGHHLPGALQEMRIWTGAMAKDQIDSQVTGSSV
ncbi:LamG domain-containing protein [Streptomyces sp. NPDC051219]|uniref:LamG domain-containing protein n=1 Tax=Streptomyces sp. NPDC051219 TaxID=3155283 RepID=UPI0034453F49